MQKQIKRQISELHKRGKSRWAIAGLTVDRAGRPPAQLAKSRWARVDRPGRPSQKTKHSFLLAVDRAVDPENPRATAFSRSTRAVDRQTCTSVHVLALAPVDRAGRPVSLKQEKNSRILNLEIFVKNILK